MSSLTRTDYASTHAGVERAEQAIDTLIDTARRFDGARGMAALLLAAVVSALLVVANQVIDTWTEGHLLAAWIGLWTVGFAALALLAAPARSMALGLRSRLQRWSAERRRAAEDHRLWSLALSDARVMADISRAMSRDAARDVLRGDY
ncbi:MAG: hypothetical protein JOY84_11785 [Curvibacter sp.]|nr:hypothetical protein [Curvibacter sp.]